MLPKAFRLLFLTMILCACSTNQRTSADTPLPSTPTASKAVFPVTRDQINLSDDLYLRQIGSGAYVITHTFPWGSNSVLIEMPDHTWVLAGSPNTPEATQVVLDWLRQQFGDFSLVAIDTGYHADNMAGNQALLATGFPVYGSDLTARLIAERGEQVRQSMLEAIGDTQSEAYQAQLAMAYLPPDHVFAAEEGLSLTLGGEEVRVIYPGPSQAPDKAAVYFPRRKLLFGSCMIVGMPNLGNTADADLQHWPEAVHQLEVLAVDVVVPGHGDRLDPGLIQHTLDLLENTH